ncbi:MAG: hypothetical protein AAFZ15_01585 [Bacteroidota bacterium]
MEKHPTLIILFCCIFQFINAQSLTLTNGNKEKTFKPGGYYEIVLADSEKDLEGDCCNFTDIKGSVTGVTADSLQMQLSWFAERNIVDGAKLAYSQVSQKGNNYGSFAHGDILYLRHYKSKKSKKRKDNLSVFGALLVTTGAVTLANTLLIDNKDDRQKLLYSAAAQGGVGFVLVFSNISKKYRFKGNQDLWRIKN